MSIFRAKGDSFHSTRQFREWSLVPAALDSPSWGVSRAVCGRSPVNLGPIRRQPRSTLVLVGTP